MSTRLQVVLSDAELARFRRVARRCGLTLSEWVRQALRGAERASATGDPDRKLQVIRGAARCEFPVAEIDQMLREIEQGSAQDLS
jgi:transposase-like protein